MYRVWALHGSVFANRDVTRYCCMNTENNRREDYTVHWDRQYTHSTTEEARYVGEM